MKRLTKILNLLLISLAVSSCGSTIPDYPNISPYSDYEVIYDDNSSTKFTDTQEKTLFSVLDSLEYQKEKIECETYSLDHLGELMFVAKRNLKDSDENEAVYVRYNINLYNGLILKSNPFISSLTSDEYALLNENDLNIIKTSLDLNKSYNVKIIDGKDNLITSIKSKYRFGEVVDIKLYPTYDAENYVYINDKYKVNNYHSDSNYWGYRFYMPAQDITIRINTDPFYIDRTYLFNEVFTWAKGLKASEVIKVGMLKGYNSINPDLSEENIVYSTSNEDIKEIFNLTRKYLIKKDDLVPPGGWFIRYYLFTENYEYSFKISNDYLYLTTFSNYYTFMFQDETLELPNIKYPL